MTAPKEKTLEDVLPQLIRDNWKNRHVGWIRPWIRLAAKELKAHRAS